MNPTSNEIERLIQACATGSLDRVKLAYDKHGESILGFRQAGTGDYRYPFYYAVRNRQMEVAKYLKSINPSNPNVILSKMELYHLYLDVLSNRNGTRPGKKRPCDKSVGEHHEVCAQFIIDGFDLLFDRETMMLAAIDSTLQRLDVDLYNILIDKFNVNPRNFTLRMADGAHNSLSSVKGFNIESPKYITFMREIKLRSLLNDR